MASIGKQGLESEDPNPGDAPVGEDEALGEEELDEILRETGVIEKQAREEARTLGPSAAQSAKPPPTITVSPDGMTAFITLPAVAGGYSDSEIRTELQHAGVVHGVDWPALSLMLAQGKSGQRIPFAWGTPPKPGEDGRIEYLFESGTHKLEEHGGRVDWHAVSVIKSVDAGTPVARKIPAAPGAPGRNVRGQVVNPRQPKDIRVAIGPGTALSPDDVNLVMATVSGAVRLDSNGRVTIDNTYLIKGDVDLSTGNVDFEGSVVINQDVRRGFTIRASGDVEVKGSIEEARVIAGGSIIARGGILGGASNASLQAGQDILARFANNATLIAGHDVILGQEAVNCGIEAEGRVVVGGKVPTKGFIRGGTVRAAKEISAYTIGTTRGAKTKLEVGYAWLLPRKLQSLEAELIHRQAQLEKTTARLRELLSERAMKELPTGKRIMLEKLRLAEEALRLTVRTLDNRRQMWLKAAQTKGTILAHGTAHSGVELTVDGCTRVLEEERQKEQFINESGKVIGLAIKGTG